MAKTLPHLDINGQNKHTVYVKNSASSVTIGDDAALDAFYNRVKDYIIMRRTPLGLQIERHERDESL